MASFPSTLSFPGTGTGTRADVDDRFLEDVAELPSSSSEGGEEGSSSFATLLIAREAVQLTELFSVGNGLLGILG
uniref:Uncharacterized protein n=1 Tax=Arundo donax TaxID=35708 RepID=A0A0A9GDM6_ARUDO